MASRVAGRFLPLLAASFVACLAWAGNNPPADATTGRLVQAAAEAALSGDAARQFALLREAVTAEPESKLARWQLGQMKVGDEWLSVEEAQRRAAADSRQAEYRELCAKHGQSAEDQLALARWCRKNDLDDEARFHWASVLAVDPKNEEAQRATGLQLHHGQLLTKAQIKKQKEEFRALAEAEKKWAPTIAKWRRAISGNDRVRRGEALDAIRALNTSDVILPLEKLTLGREAFRNDPPADLRQISEALLDALANVQGQPAAASLVRHAVFSPLKDIRTAASKRLASRPLHEYVPILLSGLAMPIESSFSVRTNADGSTHYFHSLFREGADRDWSVDLRLSSMQHQLGGRWHWFDKDGMLHFGGLTESDATLAARKTQVVSASQNRYASSVAATESRVRETNQLAEELNQRIIEVLKTATGSDKGASPKDWWNWWREENEYYAEEDKPVVSERYADTDSRYYGEPRYGKPVQNYGPLKKSGETQTYELAPPSRPVPRPPTVRPKIASTPRYTSCFAAGTLVWTKTGKRAIETLNLGELVLAQDVTSGELAYKPVIGRTIRPPSPILKVDLRGEQLRTTLGHPFFVAGAGWRMAKELADGAVLHGIAGSQRVAAVGDDGEEEAYNLVVADFNSYFVGDSGVLVHDNTPRQPTRAILPGLAAK